MKYFEWCHVPADQNYILQGSWMRRNSKVTSRPRLHVDYRHWKALRLKISCSSFEVHRTTHQCQRSKASFHNICYRRESVKVRRNFKSGFVWLHASRHQTWISLAFYLQLYFTCIRNISSVARAPMPLQRLPINPQARPGLGRRMLQWLHFLCYCYCYC